MKIRIIFDIENWLWKPNLGTFWQHTWHFEPKTFLVLKLSLENLPWKSFHIHHNKMSLYHSQECNCIFLCAHHSNACNYGNTSCQFFKRGMPKNQHKYQKETIEFWELVLWGGVKKCQNLTFKVHFLYQKLSKSFSIFFFIEEYRFRSTFFVIGIF